MPELDAIRQAEKELTQRYQGKLIVNADLDRSLVSFQANKAERGYRWFKFREGFSAKLVDYVLAALRVQSGRLLDPFAGSGSALFAASARGLHALGVELLPVGYAIIDARKRALFGDRRELAAQLARWLHTKPWRHGKGRLPFPHLPITQGAFPPETEEAVCRYLAALTGEAEESVRALLRFAALCVLEAVSYTRKDGQYLRWDCRSGRKQGARPFCKGVVPSFDSAIEAKLGEMIHDLRDSDAAPEPRGSIELLSGSCLVHVPRLASASVDCLFTSPPYCNRYDYTRTYALELALLGTDREGLRTLRQAMLSCTVENREKEGLESEYGAHLMARARRAVERQELLSAILAYLEGRKAAGLLNNPGIPRMVRNYFHELALLLCECARVLKPGAPLVMVNDNVRYEGAGLPVDLVLSDIARELGFEVEVIWALPTGKGNSSQQMARHGRDEVRKSVYVWRARGAATADAAWLKPASCPWKV